MAQEQNVSKDLYDLLTTRNFDPEVTDEQGQPSQPQEGSVFSFDYVGSSGKNYGTAVVVLTDDHELQIFYGDNLGKGMEEPDKSEWFEFLRQLSQFSARNNFYTFSPKNLNQLKHTMAGMAAIREGLFEGYYGNRRVSYDGEPTAARLMIRHSRPLGEDDQRFRNIESLFVETAEGERFKLPFTHLAGGHAMLQHVRQGGRPYDARGSHICEMVSELKTLYRFNRASAGRVIEGVNQEIVEQAQHYNASLKRDLKSLGSARGYQNYFESWNPAQATGSEALVEDLKNLFIEQHIDVRIEAALPLLAKIQQEQAMKETTVFESWADRLVEGTWALPETPEAQARLKELMSKELPLGPDATNAKEQLYDVVGDDRLFDIMHDAAQGDPDANVWDLPEVRTRMEELGVELGDLPQGTVPTQQPEQPQAPVAESLRPGEYHLATVTLDDGTQEEIKLPFDEGYREVVKQWYAKKGKTVKDIQVDWAVRSNMSEDDDHDDKHSTDRNEPDADAERSKETGEDYDDKRDLDEDSRDPMDSRTGVWDSFYEAAETNPMAQAVTRRIMNQHPEWLTRYGVEALLQAIDDVTEGESDWEEIGSSDVSAYVNYVKDHLDDRMGSREEMRDRPAFGEGEVVPITRSGYNVLRNREDYLEKRDTIYRLLARADADPETKKAAKTRLADLERAARNAGLLDTNEDRCNHTMEGESCPVHGLEECGMYENKPRFTGVPPRDTNPPEIKSTRVLPPAPNRPTFTGKPGQTPDPLDRLKNLALAKTR